MVTISDEKTINQLLDEASGIQNAPSLADIERENVPTILVHYHCNRCDRPIHGIRQFPAQDTRSWCSVCAPGVVR